MAKTGRQPHSPAEQLKSLETRFLAKVEERGELECWPWTGSKVQGYGTMWTEHGPKPATHVLWRLKRGVWPAKGEVMCHACDNPTCVNLAHLWLGTPAQNAQDASYKQRHRNQKKERCPNGHAYPTATPGLVRRCQQCLYSRPRLRAERIAQEEVEYAKIVQDRLAALAQLRRRRRT